MKMMCTRCPVLEGNTGDPPGLCIFDFYIIRSWKLLVLCSISVLFMGRRSSRASPPGMHGADPHAPCWEAPDLPRHLHPSSPAVPPPLDQILAEHEIKLANCSPFLCLFVFFFFFFVSFIIMHISYARTLGTAGFEEGK